MEEYLKAKLDSRNKYMVEAGGRLMELGNTDLSEFSDIGDDRFCKLSKLLHSVWTEGIELMSFWEH